MDAVTLSLVVVAGLLGLVIGSFLNVVVYRVPAGISLMRESRCPHCDAPVRWWQNVPVARWLALRGRCAYCGAAISARYPIVEAVTGRRLRRRGVVVRRVPRRSRAPLAAGSDGRRDRRVPVLRGDQHRPDADRPRHAPPAERDRAAELRRRRRALHDRRACSARTGGRSLAPASAWWRCSRSTSCCASSAPTAWAAATSSSPASSACTSAGSAGRRSSSARSRPSCWAASSASRSCSLRRADRRTAIPFGPWMILGAWIGIFAGEAVGRFYGDLYAI